MHIITMLFLLSILILVHELGHFSVARMLGIKVERFGFGLPFGPTLFKTRWKDVDIYVHAFLLGGYVSFPDDDPENNLPADDPGRFANKTVWERSLVVCAGVTANIITAYILVLLVAGLSGGIPAGKYNVYSAGLQPDKTFSSHYIGIKENDRIVSANGTEIDSPVKFIAIAQRSKQFDNFATEEKIQSNINKIIAKNPSLASLDKNDVLPEGKKLLLPKVQYEEPVSITDEFMLAYDEYQPVGTELSESQQELRNKLENTNFYNTEEKTTLYDLAIALSDTVHPINIVVERDGKQVSLPSAHPNKEGLIGIKLQTEEISVPVKGPISAVTGSWDYLYRNTSFMVGGLVKLFTGQIPLHDLHGIVAITKIGSDIIEHRGIWDGLLLTALISMDLAIVNLLPIPALDGGHLVFLILEKLLGKPVEEDTRETFAKYGFIFLIGLMIFIIFNDVFALMTDKL